MKKNHLKFVVNNDTNPTKAKDQEEEFVEPDHKTGNYAVWLKDPAKHVFPVPFHGIDELKTPADRAKNHVAISAEAGYKFVTERKENFAVIPNTETIKPATLEEVKKNRKAYHLDLQPKDGYEWVDADHTDGNYAVVEKNKWGKMKDWSAETWTSFKNEVSEIG